MGRSDLLPHESEWGVSICLDLIDQLDNSRTKPLQMEHDGQMSSGRSQSDVPLEGFLLREILSERRGDRYRRNPPALGVRPR